MIPVRVDDATGPVPITVALVVVNTLVFAGLWALGPEAEALVRSHGWVPGRLGSAESWRLLDPIELFGPLFTHGFLHADALHLVGNLWALVLFGAAVERRTAPLPFIGLYAAGLCAGAGLQALAQPDSVVPVIGASGAIAGLMGAMVAVRPQARVLLLVPVPIPTTARIPVWVLVGAWAGIQLLLASATAGTETTVAWWAHVGGFVTGLGWGIARRLPRTTTGSMRDRILARSAMRAPRSTR